tara:strand:- start:489 stop:914 length:426 start_codon:yes stop_codon:yes gene_type:complete
MLNIVSKKLNIIKKEEGNIYPILKSTSKYFDKFGEVYISSINANVTRAWKRHKHTSQYFIVPIGEVKFVFLVDQDERNKFKEIIIGEKNYAFINVPKNVWYGFSNLSDQPSYIINVINRPYNQDESESIDIKNFPHAGYRW